MSLQVSPGATTISYRLQTMPVRLATYLSEPFKLPDAGQFAVERLRMEKLVFVLT
jgi:hypothetical protein